MLAPPNPTPHLDVVEGTLLTQVAFFARELNSAHENPLGLPELSQDPYFTSLGVPSLKMIPFEKLESQGTTMMYNICLPL